MLEILANLISYSQEGIEPFSFLSVLKTLLLIKTHSSRSFSLQDQSRYTVTFNDGDIATLRRNALCMKSGKHYNASESLDNLPLTHPEHFR